MKDRHRQGGCTSTLRTPSRWWRRSNGASLFIVSATTTAGRRRRRPIDELMDLLAELRLDTRARAGHHPGAGSRRDDGGTLVREVRGGGGDVHRSSKAAPVATPQPATDDDGLSTSTKRRRPTGLAYAGHLLDCRHGAIASLDSSSSR
jgi:hypothetical protein